MPCASTLELFTMLTLYSQGPVFTATISVSSIYNTNSVVMVPIIWLYITVVVVRISFSIIVLCIFISLLLVTVGIVYIRMGNRINVAILVL